MANDEIEKLLPVFKNMTEAMESQSLILLDEEGKILTWNKGAEKLKGYTAEEIIGQHYSIFYLPQDRQKKLPEKLMQEALEKGSASFTGRRIRKNGNIFWGKIEMTVIKNEDGKVIGFTKIAREFSDNISGASFWFDNDGVLHTNANAIEQTPKTIAEFRQVLDSLTDGEKICTISDVRGSSLSDEAKKFAPEGMKKLYRAVAIICPEPIDTTTQEVLNIVPPEIPLKVFPSRGEAKQWIKQFLE